MASRRDTVATYGHSMTDEEWAKLTLHRKLPAEVRKPIEAELDIYGRFATATASPPSETKENLEHAAALASKLLKVIERFGPDEHRSLIECTDQSAAVSDIDVDVVIAPEVQALIDEPQNDQDAMYVVPARAAFVAATPRLDALKLLVEQQSQVAALRDRMMRAAARIERGKRDAGNVRALVKRVSQIISAHGGPLTKAKPDLHFAYELGEIARPKIGRGSMKEAIEHLGAEPKLALENSANPG